MPQLEPLNLKLTGSAEGLTATLGKVQGDISRFGGQVEQISSQFTGLGGLAGGAMTKIVAGMAAMTAGALSASAAIASIRQAMQGVDDADDAAKKLGVTFNELRGLRFAVGRITGADDSQIDAAITKLQVSLGEAARTGEGEVVTALQSLGLKASQLIEMGPVEAVKLLAEKISEVSDKSKQLQLVNDIMGKSGIAIAGLFREGSDELNSLVEKHAELSTLSDQQVAQIGAANDAWEDVAKAVGGIIEQIAAEISPLLQLIAEDAEGFAGWFKQAGVYARNLADTIAQIRGFMGDIKELGTKPFEAVGELLSLNPSKAFDALADAVVFDGASKAQAAMDRIREEAAAAVSTPKKGPTDAEIEAMESQKQAVIATKAAADSVSAKANEVQQLVESIKPKALSAVTDRAEQLRRIGEIESKRTTDTVVARRHDEVIRRFDRLISAVNNSGNLAPIDLD